ncbi:MAG TPA: Ger(x)C family spore germination protein [Symbiobacteriaceae bacterium]|nr:Ger(x)C family spore germination protein [Symbiobacteriaceae bacterium]
MRLRVRAAALLVAVSLLLTGCWDRKEIEDVGFVMAIGLDKGQGGKIAVTMQLAIPRNIAVSTTGAGGGGGGSAEKPPVLVERVEAESIGEALRDLETFTNRRISLMHTLVVVFGRELAEAGIQDHIGILTRFRQFRRGMMVMVAEGTATEILASRPRLEENPAIFLEDLTRRAHEKTARAPRTDLHHFLLPFETYGQESVMPIVRLKTARPGLEHQPDQKPQLEGTAIFRGGTMIGELNPDESEIFLAMTGEARAFLETLPTSEAGNGKIVVEMTIENTRMRVNTVAGRVSVNLSIVTEADLREIQGNVKGIVTDEGLRKLEDRLSRQLTERANKLVRRLQTEFKTDNVGFGNAVRVRFIDWPSWEQYNWPKRFPDTPIQVSIRTMIRRTGMTIQPMEIH